MDVSDIFYCIFVCLSLGVIYYFAFWEVKRSKEAITCIKKEQLFYDIAGEWFNNQLMDVARKKNGGDE